MKPCEGGLCIFGEKRLGPRQAAWYLRPEKGDTPLEAMTKKILNLLPPSGSKEWDDLRKSCAEATTTNCWCVEYWVAEFLRELRI